jgi:hypothetical protein
VAVFFRTYRLDTLPGFNFDEAHAAANAARFAAGERLDPLRLYPHGVAQEVLGGFQPGFYYLWPSAFLELFGWSLGVWRATSIVLSVGIVLLLYPLGARALGERRAFVAALLLAGSRWHVSDGRWGWVVIFADFVTAAGALLVFAGLKRPSPVPLAAGGALLALSTPLYGAALPPLVASAALVLLGSRSRRATLAFAAGASIGLIPFAVMALRQPAELLARARSASVVADAAGSSVLLFMAGNAILYAGLFLFRGDPLPFHTLPGTPALDVLSGLAFFAGLLLALRRPRRSRAAFTLFLLGAALAAGVLAQGADAPNQYRVSLAAVFVALLAADGLLVAARLLSKKVRFPWRAGVAAVVFGSLLLNARFLFATWPKERSLYEAYGGPYTRMANDVRRVLDRGRSVWVDPNLLNDPVLLRTALARDLHEASRPFSEWPAPAVRVTGRPLPEDALFLPASSAEGTPRTDPWGNVLYRIRE